MYSIEVKWTGPYEKLEREIFGEFNSREEAEARLVSRGWIKEKGPFALFFLKTRYKARVIPLVGERTRDLLYL